MSRDSRFGIIAGKRTHLVQENVNKNQTIKVDTIWNYISDLVLDLTRMPTQTVDVMEAILVLDTGFKFANDSNKSAQEFLQLQDMMQSKGLTHVKLYLLTKRPELYEILKGNVNGMEGMFYQNAEMFLIGDTMSMQFLISILQGSRDKTGVYSSKRKTLSKKERLEKEKEALIDDASRVSKESLEFGRKEPVSEINQEELIDTRHNQEMMKKQTYEERRLEREIESLKKKGQKNQKLPKKYQKILEDQEKERLKKENEKMKIQGKDIELVIDSEKEPSANSTIGDSSQIKKDTPKRKKFTDKDLSAENFTEVKNEPIIKSNVSIRTTNNSGVPTADELSELYMRLAQSDNDTIEQKLKSDLGVISFIGSRGSGVSGLVAQTAEIYAMLGKKVVILDLDLQMRSQTVYFPTYSDAVAQHKGVSNSLVRLTQVNDITTNAVPVTSRIDVLSTEKTNELIHDGFHSTISNIFENIIDDAIENYDIVLIDLPLDYLTYYIRHIDKIDKNVFVVPNKFYYIEDFFSIQLQNIIDNGDIFSNDLLSKSSIILNKFKKEHRDLEGYQLNRLKVKEMLLNAGTPYDRIPVIGEIPEYKDWEEQFATKIRYIWTDDIALGMFRKVISKII